LTGLRSGEAAAWDRLRPGDALTVVKVAPEGHEVTRYPGEVVATRDDDWVVVRATWSNRLVVLDGLEFRTGDVLLEWFSPEQWFNAFAVHAPDGALRGWYGNVTYPAWIEAHGDHPLLFWHDLYVDLVGLPDGSTVVRDDDELRDSGLATIDPSLHACVLAARGELLRRFQHRLPPFSPAGSFPSDPDRPLRVPS
jgi:protein associated with RNAse G/E